MDLRCDLVIVGSGIAGLRAAIELAGAGEVVILTKAESAEGSTGYAQGGIAAAIGADDSPALHAADTIAAGDGLCNEDAVRLLVEEGPRYVRELVAWGAAFDRQPGGELALAREGAHSVRRVLHARDATGREISRVLWQRAAAASDLRVLEHALATDLIVDNGRIAGVRFVDQRGRPQSIGARAVLLATGGAGQVYRETTNPAVASGDGVAMAYDAGASVADLEFVQFHPTVFVSPSGPRFLLSEALRGEGARLVNAAGDAFMTRYDPAGDLAPRDRVARAIGREAEASGGVFLSLQHLPEAFVRQRFPSLSEMCRRAGFDLARDRIPVGPAAHYLMGGVRTDLDARTSLPGLFAAGEVACTGVHGANRLASNSLLEGLVFGARAGAAMRRWTLDSSSTWDGPPTPRGDGPPAGAGQHAGRAPILEVVVRDLMWRHVGLFRDRAGLEDAIGRLDEAWTAMRESGGARDTARVRLASLLTVGRLIARAALRRQESRGAHFRSDFPSRNDIDWKRHCEDRAAARIERPRTMSDKVSEKTEKPEKPGKKDAYVTEITPQSVDFARWYTDVVRRAELADYSPVKGSMVIRPYGYAIWELMQQALDRRLKATGHVNAYFPLFIPESLLRKEAAHVEGFAPQVAWVTHGGDEELEERLVVRPTSEAIVGTMYAKWIQSWRDLPVLINQWANVVRWEKVTRLFLRTTEFLWQEGHTAHETEAEAEEEARRMLGVYKDFAETELAMPVMDGRKTESEKFAGAVRTYSIEALMGDGRALQAGTSHMLGQNFAKVFDIKFQARDKSLQYVWQTSWGVTTRLIGGVIMTHGDDSGLVLPPRIAPYQVVIVPIPRGNWQETVLPRARALAADLTAQGVRVVVDDRDVYTPGWKFAEWELRGVPLRLEIGPKDIEKSQVILARRDTREKTPAPMETLGTAVGGRLEAIQRNLLERARRFRDEHTSHTTSMDEFRDLMDGRPGFVIAPWCGSAACEARIKTDTQATIRNLPLDPPPPAGACIQCGRPALTDAWFAKAY